MTAGDSMGKVIALPLLAEAGRTLAAEAAKRPNAALIVSAIVLLATTPAFPQGLVREPDEVYQSFPATPAYRDFLPPSADLSAGFPPPGNQGQQGSCTAWAVGYGARSYYEGKREGWDVRQVAHQVSPAAIYNQIRHGTADCTTGTSIPDALNLLVSRGAVSLSELPYDPESCARRPQLSDGRWGIDGWMRVDTARPDDVKGEIAGGNPVVFGMNTSPSFNALTAGEIYDDTLSPRAFSHAMVVVGYSDVRQAFKVMNSWGQDWGEDGFGWVSYRAFSSLSDRAYVMRVPEAAPAPAPLPSPPSPSPTARMAVEREIRSLSCASVQIEPASGPVSSLAGFVASTADRDRVVSAAGGADARALAVRPWPQCETLLTFGGALADAHGLDVRVSHGQPAVLTAGETLVIEITTPSYPSYLYVTHLQAGGDTFHMMQPQGVVPKRLPPNTRVTLGAPPGPVFRVGPPFGSEMIVAIASASPLFQDARPRTETEREYLTAFRLAFLERPQPGTPPRLVGAAITTFTTRAP